MNRYKRYCNYDISEMSENGRKALPTVLDDMGYKGRYTLLSDVNYLKINTTYQTVARAVELAENIGNGERGHYVLLKQTAYSCLWVSEKDAKTQDEAFIKAIDAVVNDGWPIDNDPEVSVKAPVTGRWLDEYDIERLRERN